ncbi:MAG: FG-GAP repeat domain-containing protein [Myxococcota bacterium]
MSLRPKALATLPLALALVLALVACGSEEPAATPPTAPAAKPAAAPEPQEPAELPNGLVLSLAQFKTEAGKPVPGAARLEFLYRSGGDWRTSALEDEESNVFHKAMAYEGDDGLRLLTAGGTEAILKLWSLEDSALEGEAIWQKDFGGKFSRMRDVEVGDLYGDGEASIAVATHDQGVVAVLRPGADGFSVAELDAEAETFVHEIEIGDLDADGNLEVYATPSEPNRLEGGAVQTGEVVRYVPGTGEKRSVVARLPERHAK